MLYALVPLHLFLGFAVLWADSRRTPKRTAHRVRTDAVIAAETFVHTAYDTWYAAPDHPHILHGRGSPPP
ncbi:hypothetical protein [Streptomyces sp. NPDC059076]|uniref:hypothetical protein n=1 Tax=unclassified Streptomyces TaxID=2593676 RepID=UPI0036771775